MNFNNKVALITGGARGLGKDISKLLASKHCDLIINYNHSFEEAMKLKEECERKYNVKVLIIKADLSNEEEINNMVEKSIKEFNHIDILINNAGIAIDTTFDDKTKQNFIKTLDINLIGPFLLSKSVAKYMMKNKYGKIINISSTNGIDSVYPESIDYDASKAGLISLTKNLAIQFAPYINVNSVAPGWIDTDMNKDLDSDFIDKEINKILLNRFANPKEVANVVAFLASDDASYINSSVIRVDGGFRC